MSYFGDFTHRIIHNNLNYSRLTTFLDVFFSKCSLKYKAPTISFSFGAAWILALPNFFFRQLPKKYYFIYIHIMLDFFPLRCWPDKSFCSNQGPNFFWKQDQLHVWTCVACTLRIGMAKSSMQNLH